MSRRKVERERKEKREEREERREIGRISRQGTVVIQTARPFELIVDRAMYKVKLMVSVEFVYDNWSRTNMIMKAGLWNC